MPESREGITTKQKLFLQEYVKNNGNGQQAALKTYNTTDPKTAGVIASENLARPSVKEELDRILKSGNLKLKNLTQRLSEIANTEPQKGFSGSDVVQAINTGLKLYGVLNNKTTTTRLNINTNLSELSEYELRKLQEKKSKEITAILED